jgi:AraC-like DNA-binding protein
MKHFWKILAIFLFGLGEIHTQIKIEVVQYPQFSNQTGRLYLALSTDNWNASNPALELKKDAKGTYSITLPDSLTYFEYKFTQGSWSMAEGTSKGYSRPNRIYDRKKEIKPHLILVQIENWEKSPVFQFCIKSLPSNTPHDASIFLTGNFNNWNPSSQAHKMEKQTDGTYRLTVMSDLDRLEYKFTRGTWESVEGRESGKARPNRIFNKMKKSDGNMYNIDVEILSWEDLSGRLNFYSIYDILMLFAALQAILFIIAISGVQNANLDANKWLIWIMAFIAIFIFIRVLWQHREFAQTYPQITLIPDLLIFIYAPLFYFYLKKLLFKYTQFSSNWKWHFIPSALLFFSYLPYFMMDNQEFKLKIVNQNNTMFVLFGFIGICGFIFNLIYWWKSFKTLKNYKIAHETQYSYEHNVQYLNNALLVQAACLTLWLFNGGFLLYFQLFPGSFQYEIIEKCTDGVWLLFSTITYFLGYYAINQPDVFKLPVYEVQSSIYTPIPSKVASTDSNRMVEETLEIPFEKPNNIEKHPDENIMALAEKVHDYLLKNKTYTNPNLSLYEMAKKLRVSPHQLSKAINDGFHMNFFDFINSYRIEEFKKLAKDNRHKHHTFVSLAYEVGFNSKTAFNRSFKKLTKVTPSEYLHSDQE